MTLTPAIKNESAVATIEQARAVAEIQAALIVARQAPRDLQRVEANILTFCKNRHFADAAEWAYKRGGELLTGPSIRLMEGIALCMGNMHYGFREVARKDDVSEVEAYAHDLETNTRVSRLFQVRHARDTKSGLKALTSERDKYEVVANMAQRRVRACLEEIIPSHIIEMAREACNATITQDIGDVKKAMDKMVEAFKGLGVTVQDLEAYLQRSLDSVVPADIVVFRKIYRSIRDGVATKEDFFKPQPMDLEAKGKKARKPKTKAKPKPRTEPQPQPETEAEPNMEPEF